MIGKSPVGRWTLQVPNTPAVRRVFDQPPRNAEPPAELAADILLVITYSGRTPEWPA